MLSSVYQKQINIFDMTDYWELLELFKCGSDEYTLNALLDFCVIWFFKTFHTDRNPVMKHKCTKTEKNSHQPS